MKGTITFYWDDGYELTKVIGASVRGLLYNGERPAYYRIHIEDQIITNKDILHLDKFNQWMFENVSFVLGRRKK